MARKPSKSEERNSSELSDATGGTIYLIIIQVASRALTFAGNQFVLRYLSPQLIGIAVQLELYSISVLYFARESLRVALQRQSSQNGVDAGSDRKAASSARSRQTQVVVNLSYLAIGIGVALTVVFGWLYYKGQSSNTEIQESPYFGLSLQIYALATVIELCSEPCFVVIQERLLYKSRARSETVAAISKCAATCLVTLLINYKGKRPSVLPFAIGQTAYAIVLASGYMATVLPLSREDIFSMLPKAIETSTQHLASRFYRPLVSLAGAIYAQSVFKQILTQGDALILGFLASLEDQGAFALASNYGGLMARLLFQPIEESSRNAFGKLLSRVDKDGKLDSQSLNSAVKQLSDILYLYSIVAILSSCFLYTLLPLLVKVLVGRAWFSSEIAGILSIYCYYIPFMAYNGILDAFVTSVATPAELQQQSLWMGAFTAGYFAAAYILLTILDLGAKGLVLGNIINMLLRILWSVWFITRYMRKNNGALNLIRDVLPKPTTFMAGLVAAGMMRGRDLNQKQDIAAMIDVISISAIGGSIMQVCVGAFLGHRSANEF